VNGWPQAGHRLAVSLRLSLRHGIGAPGGGLAGIPGGRGDGARPQPARTRSRPRWSLLHEALRGQVIGGAALDVTDPEPLPDGHPLWDLDNCIITPHTAEMVERILNLCIGHNVAAFAAGQPLAGLVDLAAGY
jgi:hypothetical protein